MKPSKISELLEIINRTANNTDFSKPAKLEIDLFMQQLRDLYATLDEMRNAPAQSETVPEVKVAKRSFNPNQNILLNEPEEKPIVTEVVIKQPEVVVPEIKQVEPPPVVEKVSPIVKEEPAIVKRTEVVQEVKVTEVKQTPLSKTSINESVQTVASINEKLKVASQEVHRKLSTKPLKDLIDLNKKFTLLNELFKGNSEAYSAAIHHIDSLSSVDEAENFIKSELASNYFWDESSQSARMFMKLVKQKFGVE